MLELIDHEDLGKFIKTCRIGKQMTQSRLAECVGVHKGSIGSWETGANGPSIRNLVKVMLVLKIDYEFFRKEMSRFQSRQIDKTWKMYT